LCHAFVQDREVTTLKAILCLACRSLKALKMRMSEGYVRDEEDLQYFGELYYQSVAGMTALERLDLSGRCVDDEGDSN